MKKVLIGFAAIGAAIALRPLLKRIGRKMSEHCEQMMAEYGAAGKPAEMGEHFDQDAARFTGDREPVGTA
jgi:hypothetical protein